MRHVRIFAPLLCATLLAAGTASAQTADGAPFYLDCDVTTASRAATAVEFLIESCDRSQGYGF